MSGHQVVPSPHSGLEHSGPWRRDERWRTLLEINNAIITKLTQEDLVDAICEALQRVLPVSRAALTLYQPERDTLRIVAVSRHWTSDYFRPGTELDRDDSISGWVFDHQQPLLRRDLESEAGSPIERRLLAEGIRSFCVVPLMLRGAPLGTLNQPLVRSVAPAGIRTSSPRVASTAPVPAPAPTPAPIAAPFLPSAMAPIAAPTPAPMPIFFASSPLVASASCTILAVCIL